VVTMAVAPDPKEIYASAREEGRRRLFMPPLEQVATGFIAGVTIVFGITALGVVEGLIQSSGPGQILGALAFALGLVFLIVGRSELFSENFFDPVAAAIAEGDRSVWVRLLRLWFVILVLNFAGGAVLIAFMTIQGALPSGAAQALVHVAEEVASKEWPATFARAVLAGALITLLSFLLEAVHTVLGRIVLAYMVGFLLAVGAFDHVVVSGLQLLYGIWLGSTQVGYGDFGLNVLVATAGNLVGGLLLMTLTHTAQVKGAREGSS
jgi:formate/nitrite transporter FocA (FNT family)